MKKANLSTIMSVAHDIAKIAANNYNCKKSEISFSECLRQAWGMWKEMIKEESEKKVSSCVAKVKKVNKIFRRYSNQVELVIRGGIKGTGKILAKQDFYPELENIHESANTLFKREVQGKKYKRLIVENW